jgi:hypothetical protein
MSNDSPIHDFVLPRLTLLVDDAVAAGAPREVAVAVIIDLITSSRFDTAAPDPETDSAPHMDWDRCSDAPMLVAGVIPIGGPGIGAQDEADFVRPFDGIHE